MAVLPLINEKTPPTLNGQSNPDQVHWLYVEILQNTCYIARRTTNSPGIFSKCKEQIYCTAACLFSEIGYRSTSMQDILAAPYIRAASLYSHIDNKNELLWSTTVRVVDEFDGLCRLNQIGVG